MIGAAVAEFPYAGGVGTLTPHSVPDPLPRLLADPSVERIYLARAEPGGGDVDAASEGVYTDGTAIQSALPEPYAFGVELPGPSFSGLARTTPSNLVIGNADRRFDGVVDYEWLGARVPVYVGPKGARGEQDFSNFTRILEAFSEGIVFNADTITALMRDQAFRLTRRLEVERYMGTGACLRFDGSGDRVDFGDVLDKGVGDSFEFEILFKSTNLGTSKTLMSKKAGGADNTAGWRLNFNASNNLLCQVSDGTNALTFGIGNTAGTATLDGRWHRSILRVDRSNQTATIRVLNRDGTEYRAEQNISTVGSLANGDPLQVGALNSTTVWIGDLDDFRSWGTVRTEAQQDEDAFREIPEGSSGLDLYAKFNEGAGSIASDSTGKGATGTITGAAWVGSLEGDASLAGIPKPNAFGQRRQVRPFLVDPQRLVYQFHNGSMEAVDAFRDKGDDLTPGSNLSDIYSATPAGGSFNTQLDGGYVRLAASPQGEVTGDIRGDNGGALGYQDGAAGIARKILTERAGFGGIDDLDTASFTELANAQPATVGYYFDEDINFDEALHEVLDGVNSFLSPTRTGAWQVGRIGDPGSKIPTVAWDVDVDVQEVIEIAPVATLPKEVRVSYRPYQTTLSADQVAGTVDAATRDDFGREVRWATARAEGYADLPEDAASFEFASSFDTYDAAYAEAQRLLVWLGLRPRFYRLNLKEGTLAYYIGSLVSLRWDRYSLSTPKPLWITSVQERAGSNSEADSVEVVAVG